MIIFIRIQGLLGFQLHRILIRFRITAGFIINYCLFSSLLHIRIEIYFLVWFFLLVCRQFTRPSLLQYCRAMHLLPCSFYWIQKIHPSQSIQVVLLNAYEMVKLHYQSTQLAFICFSKFSFLRIGWWPLMDLSKMRPTSFIILSHGRQFCSFFEEI